MEKFVISIQFLTYDRETKDIWRTYEHDPKDKIDEDWHRNIKLEILKELSRKIKKKYGKNCDIAIDNGMIVIISRLINKEGKRTNLEKITDLKAEDYFEHITRFITLSIMKLITKYPYKVVIAEQLSEQLRTNFKIYLVLQNS